MGLDWLPGPKPMVGFEAEFEAIWHRIQNHEGPSDAEVQRVNAITTSAYESLAAPRVDIDEVATEWARKRYDAPEGKSIEQFLAGLNGYYVLELVPPCDGIPRYSNGEVGNVDRYSFRAQFLGDCREIISDELFYSAWESKLVAETKVYGTELLQSATGFADRHGLYVRAVPPDDPESAEFLLDVVYSAAKWCQFWADRGHWLEAYF